MTTKTDDIDKARLFVEEKRISKLVGKEDEFENYYKVAGINDDYLVILPAYCTCIHFLLNCVKEKDKVCKHILAVRMVGDNIPEVSADDWLDLIFKADR